jgi:hypothetical protein
MHMKLHGWKTVSGFFFTVAIAAVGGGGAELGCSATASGSGSSSTSSGGSSSGVVILPDPTGCNQDSTVDCSGGGDGFSCATGDNPEAEDSTYVCSTPQADAANGGDDFCCFTGGSFSSGSCVSDDDLTSVCPDADSYGFQCDSGDEPTSEDPDLDQCSTATPDADGVHDDFCCTYTGTGGGSSSGGSSSGGLPTGCTADTSVDCSGGGDPYSCASGDNPENEDPTLSCSTPQADATSGGDDFCCFSEPSGDFSSSTCVADDDITSVCPDADSYGYQCVSGDDPSTLDSTLTNCSAATPDADGVHDDFCCTLG